MISKLGRIFYCAIICIIANYVIRVIFKESYWQLDGNDFAIILPHKSFVKM